LAMALASQPATAMPVGLAASVTGAALAGAAMPGGFMSMTTLQVGLISAVAAAGVAGWVTQARTNDALRAEIAALQRSEQQAAELQAQNQALAREAAENEVLRVDPKDLARLRAEVRVMQARVTPRTATSVPHSSQPIVPLPIADPDTTVQVRLPDADADTALSMIGIFTGRKVARDRSVGKILGTVNVVFPGPVTKAEAVERVQMVLRDSCGVVVEARPDGTLFVKRANR
jgi:hypothetical protein